MRRGRAGSWPTTESSTRAGPDHFMRSPGRTSRWNLSVLHPEQIAQLQKKPVRRAAQVAEPERLRLAERRAVAQEYDGARRRLVGEQQVVPEVVRDDRARGPPFTSSGCPVRGSSSAAWSSAKYCPM